MTAGDSTSVLVAVGHVGWDETSLDGSLARVPGGSLLHFSAGMAAVGAAATLVGYGDEAALGECLKDHRLLAHDYSQLVPCEPNSVVFRIFYKGQRFQRDAFSMVLPDSRPTITGLHRTVAGARFIHVSAMPPDHLRELLTALPGELDAELSLQLHISQLDSDTGTCLEAVARARRVFASAEELMALTGIGTPQGALRKLQEARDKTWIMTGMPTVWVADRGNLLSFVTRPVSPVDPTGAGDAFAGACMGALSQGLALSAAVQIAMCVGLLAVLGRSTESLADLLGTSKNDPRSP